MIAGIMAGGRPLTGVAAGGDPHWANVSCLLHLDGTNNGTVFTDQKGKTWSAVGGAVTKTDASVFGGSSLYVAGSSERIETASHADFAFGTGDFTIEFAMSRQNNNASSLQMFGVMSGATPRIGAQLSAPAGGAPASIRVFVGATTVLTSSALLPALPAPWSWIMLRRASGVYTLHIDGVLAGTSALRADNLAQGAFQLGGNTSWSASVIGHFDELRVTKGVARVVTVPTEPFPNS